MDNEFVYKEAKRLSNMIAEWTKFGSSSEEECPDDYRALMWLESNIEYAMYSMSEDRFEKMMDATIRKSLIADTLQKRINFSKICHTVEIRKDWANALRSVKQGSDLSYDIGFSFYTSDLKQLARLHKANRYRKKIEDLLEDCNFHTECGQFAEGDYSILEVSA